MTINGARQFRGNDGKSYLVMNTPMADRHKGKYILGVKVNGIYKLCYGMCRNLLHFDTIKDAQREVLYSADFIRTMQGAMVARDGWDQLGLGKDAVEFVVHKGQMEAKNKAMGVWFSQSFFMQVLAVSVVHMSAYMWAYLAF